MPRFDFDPELIVGIILGDLSAADYPSLSVTPLYEPHPFKDEMVLGLTVSIGPVQGQTVREVLVTKYIDPWDLERTAWATYHSAARKISFKLFEQDPRIGLPLSEGFPDCPLFDPPYLAAPYLNYLREKGGDGIWKKKPETIEVRKHLTTCPFCESPIYPYGGSRKVGVWCGGNVGFAHEDCAPWVTPRSA